MEEDDTNPQGGTHQHIIVDQVELIDAQGFDLVQVREYDVTDYYSTSEDLIFLLKHTPIIPRFVK